MKSDAYRIVNFCFCLIFGAVIFYSWYFYPFDHPLDCVLRSITGRDCPSCGMSRSFSFFTRMEWTAGISYNRIALPVFIFVLSQFLWRGVSLLFPLALTRRVLRMDLLISVSFFLFAFLPLLIQLIEYGNQS